MSEVRLKTRQFNFRLDPDLASEFEEYCEENGIKFTQFIDAAIRNALGKPVPLPARVLGIESASHAIKPVDSLNMDSQRIETLEERLARLEAEMGKYAA